MRFGPALMTSCNEQRVVACAVTMGRMKPSLQIDFVSDVACPWCAIGLASLEEALRRTSDVLTAQIRLQPFELNPDMPPGGENHDDYLGRRYGMSPAQLAAGRAQLRERGAAVGFAFNVTPESRIRNTFDAHRLLHWADTQGRQLELKRALFRANFSDNADISDRQTLVGLAESAGLDAAAAREALAGHQHGGEVRAAEQLWHSRGIQGVPAIIIQGKWLISGGQTPEVFEQALREIAARLVPGGQQS